MPNLIKKSWTVSSLEFSTKKVAHLIQMILLFEQEEYVTMQAGIGGWSGGSIFAQNSAAFCLEAFHIDQHPMKPGPEK